MLLMAAVKPRHERLLQQFCEMTLGLTSRMVRHAVIDIAADAAKREIRAMAAAPL